MSVAIRYIAVLVVAVMLPGCKDEQPNYEHAEEHPEGHDHHEEGHGHGDAPAMRITRWSPLFELFAEHAPAVSGQEVSLLAHVTILDGFRAVERGAARLELVGPATIQASASGPVRPGIYRISFTPEMPGLYQGRLVIDDASSGASGDGSGRVSGAIEGIEVQVFAGAAAAHEAAPDDDDGGLIELLKEQQWGVPFATAWAEEGSLIASIQVAGTVDTPPGGSAEVGAPVAGRVMATARGLPRPGQAVKKGQVLATLVPALSSPEDAARASLAVAEAEARLAAARAAQARAERLIRDEAISQRELEDAGREVQVAQEAVRAARQRAELFSGASAGGGAGAWRLVAPIDGIVTHVHATLGAQVLPGQVLFGMVDDRELWIRARVPEQDAARLRADRDASYLVAGLERWHSIDVTGDGAGDGAGQETGKAAGDGAGQETGKATGDGAGQETGKATGASVVMVGRTVDPLSRTVEVIYALHAPDPALRVGGLVQVSLPVGQDFRGVVIPHSAIVDDEGRDVVFVQVDGEHFAERPVRTGPRAGERIGIESGLAVGERVVIRGAHLVRLADRASSSEPHGHIH